MTAVIPHRIDPAKRMHRYYRMEVQPDLFGDWWLMESGAVLAAAGN